MGAMIEKATTAFQQIEAGFERLSPEHDGLISSLFEGDLDRLRVLGRKIRHMAEDESARREKS